MKAKAKRPWNRDAQVRHVRTLVPIELHLEMRRIAADMGLDLMQAYPRILERGVKAIREQPAA